MKRLILSVALIIISLSGNLYAQARVSGQRTNSVFNISDDYIYNTHTVYLEHDAKMIIELADVTDYVMLNNLDSLDGRFGLETMCVAGGMGQAMIIERLH